MKKLTKKNRDLNARKAPARKGAKKAAKPVARVKAKPKPGARAAPKLKPIAPALGALVDSATGKPFGPPRLTPRSDGLKLKDKLTPAERKELLKLAPRPADTRWPSEIIVGKRFRKAMGDLDAMAHSIDSMRTRDGKPFLLQRIGINLDNELIWGERRLLGWRRSKVALTDPIKVEVLDVDAVIVGEYIENDPQLRKNFTPEEAVEIVQAMRPRQRELLGLEQAARPSATRAAPGRKATGKAGGRVTDRAAAFTGKSGRTIEKAEAVVEAARADEKFRPLVDDMNRTGKVDGPFRRLEIMRAADKIRNEPPPLPGNGPYRTVVIDYPWPHEGDAEQEEIDAAGRSLRPYPPMAIKSGCHYMREQVAPLLAAQVTLYFWVTNWHLVRGYHQHLLSALGWTEGGNTMLTWVKDKIGRGQILRDQTEHCIILTRGKPVINVLGEDPPTTVLYGPRRENSRKPDEFYRLVERLSPAPRYASLFSTGGEGELWDGHGDQVEKHAPAAAGDDEAEWKALGAIEGGVAIEGPVHSNLVVAGLIERDDTLAHKWSLTPAGTDRLAELDGKFGQDKAKAREFKLLQILETIAGNPLYEPSETDAWFVEQLGQLTKRTEGTYRKPTRTKLNAAGRKRLAALDVAFRSGELPAPGEGNSPVEVPQPADRTDPALIDAAVKAGHTVSMTLDHVDASTSYSVATCQCNWTHRVRRSLTSHADQDAAIEAHWREMLQWKAFATPAPEMPPADDGLELPEILRRKPVEAA